MTGKEQLFKDKLLEFRSELDKNPNRFKRYEIEAALLKREIAKQGLNKNHSIFRNITNAVMEIGYFVSVTYQRTDGYAELICQE